MPCHHTLEEYLVAWLEGSGRRDDPTAPLFPTLSRKTKAPTRSPMTQPDAWQIIRRRAKKAGIQTLINNHTFRATGITAYLKNGGTLEKAQLMAAHESPRTTKLYDRTADQITLDEVERILI